MSETFYRVHWNGNPGFSLANAWSAPWGSEAVAEGQYECFSCGGTGDGRTEVLCPRCRGDGVDADWNSCDPCEGMGFTVEERCPHCEEGRRQCERGYSCETSPEALIAYFRDHGAPGAGETVIVFEGEQAGTGLDGEPTVVPDRVTQTMTWEQFTARYAGEAA